MKITSAFVALAVALATTSKACLVMEGEWESSFDGRDGTRDRLHITLTDHKSERCSYHGDFPGVGLQWLNCRDGELASIEQVDGRGNWAGYYSYAVTISTSVPAEKRVWSGRPYYGMGYKLNARNYGC